MPHHTTPHRYHILRSFRRALRVIKLWARRRGIYSNVLLTPLSSSLWPPLTTEAAILSLSHHYRTPQIKFFQQVFGFLGGISWAILVVREGLSYHLGPVSESTFLFCTGARVPAVPQFVSGCHRHQIFFHLRHVGEQVTLVCVGG